MTSKERIRAVLNHQQPDMLPIDFGAHRSSGISAIAYNHLKEKMGLDLHTTKLYDIMQQLAIPENEVLDRFGADVVQILQLYPAFNARVDSWKPGVLQDGSPCQVPNNLNPVRNARGALDIFNDQGTLIARQPVGGLYYDNMNYFLKDVEDISELKSAW